MRTTILVLCALGLLSAVLFAALSPVSANDRIGENIVKVYTTSNSYSYYTPWQMVGPANYEGSGCIIARRHGGGSSNGGSDAGERLILTNAHVVSNHTFITVKRTGQTKKYVAKVEFVAHECDLALLSVADPKFFPDSTPLEIGELSRVTDEVSVYGYPNGAEQLTITKGIVSRVSHETYAHSSASLLACQIDAPINEGNSGGPVTTGGRIVGIAMMAGYGENEGYMVPVPVIKHFLVDVEDGVYGGVPDLAIQTQTMENPSLRRFYGLQDESAGILVRNVYTGSPAKGLLFPGDVLLSIDGTEVAADGTITLRDEERTSYTYIVQSKQVGESVTVRVMRGGKPQDVPVKLTIPSGAYRLVPNEQFDTPPVYYIYGGFVFAPLTVNLMKEWGNEWFRDAPLSFLQPFMTGEPTETQREVVVIVDILSDEINLGYENSYWDVVVFANGKRIGSIADLAGALESNRGLFQVIETQRRAQIILNRKEAEKGAKRILKQYKIESERSEGFR